MFDIVGTILSDRLTDRWDAHSLLLTYYLLRGLSLFALDPALAHGGGGLLGFMAFVLAGVAWSRPPV